MSSKQFIKALQYYRDNPDKFFEDAFDEFIPNNHQKKLFKALGDGAEHITIKSGHGTGKTTSLALIIIWYMLTHPHARIPCTAPTQAQLFDVLWPEIKKWINRLKDPKLREFFVWTQTHVYCKNYPETWFAVARSSNKAENMQGFHADNLLFVIDEGSGVEQEIMEVVQGALTTEGALCIMTGNPTQVSGTFYDSFHKEREYWNQFTFSCIDSEMSGMDKYVERMKGKYGEESNIFKVRVLGEFPDSSDDTIIPLSWAEQAVSNDFEDVMYDTIHIGVDVARFGDDKTIIIVRKNNKVIKFIERHKQSTMETVGNVMMEIAQYSDKHKIRVFVDDTGVGGGVTDRLKELKPRNTLIKGINNGSSSIYPDKFKNKGAELWWNMRENIRDWDIPNREQLIADLTSRKYNLTSKGQIEVESKDDMKKRGLPSPDTADALSLAFYDEVKGKSKVSIIW